MKIVSSALRMDATSAHREVVGTGVKAANNAVSAAGERFSLDLPRFEANMSRAGINKERQKIESQTEVKSAGGHSRHQLVEEKEVTHLVSQVAGEKAHIQEINQTGTNITLGEEEGEAVPLNDRGLRSGLLSVQLERVEYKQEQIQVETTGSVKTGDGRDISLQMNISMEREEAYRERLAVQQISSRFVDPLVLSFSDGLSVLSENEISFDLDGDGEQDRINGLNNGSGYLVFDRNEDGLVNDGSELFGPMSGSGYGELRIFDEDDNNWIDENDPAFEQLKIWIGAGGDEARLVSLAEAGVGALSLANSSSHFNLKDAEGRVLGQVSNTGLFLTENGEVRPLVEVDLNTLEEPGAEAEVASGAMQAALQGLQKVIAVRRQRLERLAAIQLSGLHQKKVEDREEWLLQRLWEMREQRMERK